MNVKILFFPLSVTIALAIGIFYVKPEIDTALLNRSASTEKTEFASVAATKVQNIKALESNLNANKDNEATVLRYYPNTRDDDHILDEVNFLASQSGLALASVKIEDTTTIAAPAAVEEVTTGSAEIFATSADVNAIKATAIEDVKPKSLQVNVSALGSYESIRDLVNKIEHSDRFQNFTTIDIERAKVVAQDGKEGENTNLLSASLTIDFSYLPKVKARGNFNREVFGKSAFDFGIVEDLKQYTTAPVPAIEAGASGTANPFLR